MTGIHERASVIRGYAGNDSYFYEESNAVAEKKKTLIKRVWDKLIEWWEKVMKTCHDMMSRYQKDENRTVMVDKDVPKMLPATKTFIERTKSFMKKPSTAAFIAILTTIGIFVAVYKKLQKKCALAEELITAKKDNIREGNIADKKLYDKLDSINKIHNDNVAIAELELEMSGIQLKKLQSQYNNAQADLKKFMDDMKKAEENLLNFGFTKERIDQVGIGSAEDKAYMKSAPGKIRDLERDIKNAKKDVKNKYKTLDKIKNYGDNDDVSNAYREYFDLKSVITSNISAQNKKMLKEFGCELDLGHVPSPGEMLRILVRKVCSTIFEVFKQIINPKKG